MLERSTTGRRRLVHASQLDACCYEKLPTYDRECKPVCSLKCFLSLRITHSVWASVGWCSLLLAAETARIVKKHKNASRAKWYKKWWSPTQISHRFLFKESSIPSSVGVQAGLQARTIHLLEHLL